MTTQQLILANLRSQIAGYNELLMLTRDMPDADRVYYAGKIKEGIERCEEMVRRENKAYGNEFLHY